MAISNPQFVSGISFTTHTTKDGMLTLQKQWFTKATNPSTYRILEMLNVSNSHQSTHDVDRGLLCSLHLLAQDRVTETVSSQT